MNGIEKSRFEHFMNGFVAAAQLLHRAAENGFFVEYVCLAASVIDGGLRIGLILQHQLKTRSSEVLNDLLFQGADDTIVTEREVYRRARTENVIDEKLFQKLEGLYRERNRVVHRYIISDLTTRRVLEIAVRFEQILPAVNQAIGLLETRQVESGVGMTRTGEMPGLSRTIEEMSKAKHGNLALNRALKNGGT